MCSQVINYSSPLPFTLHKSMRGRKDLKIRIKGFLHPPRPPPPDSWLAVSTGTIFFTFGNATCFLELMRKHFSGEQPQ